MKTYGIGKAKALKKCLELGVSPAKPATFDLTLKQDNDKKTERQNLAFYEKIKSIRGLKFKARLPIRGQRNKTNGKTARKKALSIKS